MSRPDGTTPEEARAPWTLRRRDRQLADVLTAALAYARDREYAGWRVDGRPPEGLAGSLPVGSARLGGVAGALARRTPLDLRPFVLGGRRRSVGAAAQFAMANQVASWLGRADPTAVDDPADTDYLDEADRLASWLRANAREDGFWGTTGVGSDGGGVTGSGEATPDGDGDEATIDGASEGHGSGGDDGADSVDLAATSLAVRALVRTVFIDADHADVARAVGGALVRNPDVLAETRSPGRPRRRTEVVPVDVAAVAARLLLDLYGHLGTSWLLEAAEEVLDDVVSRQEARGGWTDGGRPLDTHRTGRVVEALQCHEAVTGRQQYEGVLADALHFYQRTLFEPDGAPNAGPTDPYPRTVDAAAQGVVVFTNEGDYRFARHVLDWTLEHLHAGDGRFYVRDRRLRTTRQVRMDRCQARMTYAIAEYLRSRYIDAGDPGGSRPA